MFFKKQKTHKKFDKRIMNKEKGFIYSVGIPFSEEVPWNEICANIVEVFGLPGYKFVTEASPGYFKILFKAEKDKLMCDLLVSEYL